MVPAVIACVIAVGDVTACGVVQKRKRENVTKDSGVVTGEFRARANLFWGF